MTDDERAIRRVVETWMTATRRGDHATVLGLMTDDVVFMVPNRPPFGKEAFASQSEGLGGVRIDGKSEIVELKVLGDWAFLRSRLKVSMTSEGGETVHRSGYALTLMRKEPDGRWRLARDANLLSTQA
jgi:uncharacterized protein (TIGR02246 family)